MAEDDDVNICWMMARELTRRGYQATAFFEGQSALQHVLVHYPDALVIDENMQGLRMWRRLPILYLR